MFKSWILLFSLLCCGSACPECEAIDAAYLELHAECGVELDEAPMCRRSNLETRRCQQACLEEMPCEFVAGSAWSMERGAWAYGDYYECNKACSDWSQAPVP